MLFRYVIDACVVHTFVHTWIVCIASCNCTQTTRLGDSVCVCVCCSHKMQTHRKHKMHTTRLCLCAIIKYDNKMAISIVLFVVHTHKINTLCTAIKLGWVILGWWVEKWIGRELLIRCDHIFSESGMGHHYCMRSKSMNLSYYSTHNVKCVGVFFLWDYSNKSIFLPELNTGPFLIPLFIDLPWMRTLEYRTNVCVRFRATLFQQDVTLFRICPHS